MGGAKDAVGIEVEIGGANILLGICDCIPYTANTDIMDPPLRRQPLYFPPVKEDFGNKDK